MIKRIPTKTRRLLPTRTEILLGLALAAALLIFGEFTEQRRQTYIQAICEDDPQAEECHTLLKEHDHASQTSH